MEKVDSLLNSLDNIHISHPGKNCLRAEILSEETSKNYIEGQSNSMSLSHRQKLYTNNHPSVLKRLKIVSSHRTIYSCF